MFDFHTLLLSGPTTLAHSAPSPVALVGHTRHTRHTRYTRLTRQTRHPLRTDSLLFGRFWAVGDRVQRAGVQRNVWELFQHQGPERYAALALRETQQRMGGGLQRDRPSS